MTTANKPLFSVVIPAYNYAHCLRRAVESVLHQPGDDYELLVVNDGSTDNTAELLETLAGEYPGRFRFITRGNSGLAATRNFGIDNTSGQYLIFLDADDAFVEDALGPCRRALAKERVELLIGGHIAIHEDGREKQVLPSQPAVDPYLRVKDYLITKKLALSNGATLMGRNIFNGYRYPEQFRNSEDIAVFAYALANFSVSSVQAPIARIHKHGDSLRHNVALAKQIGGRVVEEVFAIERLPAHFQSLKKQFALQRLLSLSRTCYLSRDYFGCRCFYRQAFCMSWAVVFKISYLRKYLLSVLKRQ